MKVFVAGASGAIGRRLVPLLVASGHEVIGTTSSPAGVLPLRDLGAEPVVLDGLDREAVVDAVMRSRAEVVIHEMTGIASVRSYRNLDAEFTLTNRLRTQGTDALIEGAQEAGARRFVAQSFGAWNYREGVKVPPRQRQTLAAIDYLEQAVLGAEGLEGVALRYGFLYGPGTGFAPDGSMSEMVRERKFPIVGGGGGEWSFVHVDDAALATLAAVERGAPGVYEIVDDHPAPVAEWVPELATVLGAQPPRHVPKWLGRLASGEVGVGIMTRVSGASNADAKRALSWTPRFPTIHEGFAGGLRDLPLPRPPQAMRFLVDPRRAAS